MLRSRITVGIIHGLLLSLYLLVIYIPDIKATLGGACDSCNGTNETCTNGNGTCVCQEGFYDSNGTDTGGTCNPKFNLSSNCNNVAGVHVCMDPNAICSGGQCACDSNYYDDNGATSGGTCQPKVNLGSNCNNVAGVRVCMDPNAICSGGQCACDSNYYDDNGATSGGACQSKVNLGSNCNNVAGVRVCMDPNAICSGGQCACDSNYYDDNGATSGGACQSKVNLGSNCNNVAGVRVCMDPNAICSGGQCACDSNYYDDNGATSGGACQSKVNLGSNCNNVAGVRVCMDPNAICSGGQCACDSNYYDDNGATSGGACQSKVNLGSNCNNVAGVRVCMDPNAICSGGQCACDSNYYDDNGATSGGACQSKVNLGSNCNNVAGVRVCMDPNAVCSGGQCACDSNYYDDNGATSGGTCQPKVNLGSNCDNLAGVRVCMDPNAICSGGQCACDSNYYDDNGATSGGTCQPKVNLGSSCDNVAGVRVCMDPNAICSGGQCACDSNYYDDNGATSGGTCQPKVNLGSNCNNVAGVRVCMDPNAICSGGKCACDSTYYDNNGATSGGTCQPITNLRVTSLVYGIITENTIPIFWTHPSDKAAVSFYRVAYWPADTTTVVNQTNVGNQTSFNLNNLDPGKKYSISVFSVNTQTDLPERSTSVTKNQTTKPGIPGALLKDKDINASSGSITLEWNRSIGVVTGYGGSLESTTLFIIYNKTFNTSGITPSQTFSELKSGTWYNFTVQAVIGYTDTMTLYSNIRTQLIRTLVQVPNPPTNLSCFDATDSAITLKWIQPQLPNGDIISYFIVIQRTQPHQEPYNITSQGTNVQYTVNGLTAGSFYTFQVYTMNENYTSTSFAQKTSCETKAQMAGAPEDLLVTNVTSRSGTVTWNRPSNLNGTHYGYSLQILNGSVCIREVIWKCTDCQGAFPSLPNPCSDRSQQTASSTALLDSQYYAAMDLFPDTNYTVTVAAITGVGIGHRASKYLPTKEEAPSKPLILLVRNITAKTATVDWNMDEVRPGQTNYIIIATGISPAETRTRSVSGFFNTSYEFIDLEEYWNYSVIVQANTSIGSNRSDPYNFTTLAGPAGLVSHFSIDKGTGEDAYVTAVVSWKLPLVLERNGPIDKFYVQQNERNNASISKILMVQSDETYTTNFSVDPDVFYTFKVRAANDRFNGTDNVLSYSAPAGPPVNTIEMQGIHVIPVEKFSSPSQTSFQIEINNAFFNDTKNGATKLKGLICCKECKKANSTTMKPSEINNIKTYTQAQKFNLNQYRLPVPPANLSSGETGSKTRRKRNINSVTVYQVGIESCANESDSYFCNGPLNPGTSYSIIAFVCTNGGCTLSNSYGPFITLAVPDNTAFPVGAVAGGIVGGVAAIILIAVILLLLRRRSKKLGKTRKRVDDDEPTDMANLSKIKKQRPINLGNFAEYVADYHKDSNLKFSEEYDDLKALSPSHPHEAADMEENRLKNRFVNILPFDHTRVKLRPIDDVSGSDYINANYLPGFSKTREYIACQGPIPATIDDHWRLIWEQNVRVIVMLTQYKEENRVKCEQYMPLEPKDPKQYGDLVVECMTYSSMNSFEYRTLKIRLGEKERTIKHFHFLSWRDYSANVQLDTMIDFIKKVRSFIQPPDVEGPMIIHCSAGVGRTGTYITIDYAMQLIDKYGPDSTIDIFNFVLKMRENRTTMVQTEQQYIFIHDCIKEYLDRFKTYENQAFNTEEENLYQNTAETMDLYQNVSFNSTQKTEL